MKILLLLIISILPVIIVAGYIYKKDKHKEPFKLLIKLFISGLFSVFITIIVSNILRIIFPFFGMEEERLNLFQLVISVFFGIAFIEEISKWIMIYFLSYKNKEFDEFYDMIVYSVFVSLGFALFENIVYVFNQGISIGILRAIFSVPGHAFNGVFMGYYLGLAKIASLIGNKSLEKKNKIFSIVVPILLHGIYDYCLLSGKVVLYLMFLFFIVSLYIIALKKVNKISKITGKMRY